MQFKLALAFVALFFYLAILNVGDSVVVAVAMLGVVITIGFHDVQAAINGSRDAK